jgi:AcrR family transcriptional regulator
MPEAILTKSTRESILDATDRLLGRLGYQKTTIDDLAREAGVARRTVYLHFPSKEEIFLCSIDRVVEHLLARLAELAASDATPPERLRRMLLERVLYRFDSVREYHRSLDELLAVLRPAYLRRRDRYFRAEADLLAGVLAEGVRRGDLETVEVPATARSLVTATNALIPAALSAAELGSRDSVEQEAARVADLLLRGLLPRPRSHA